MTIFAISDLHLFHANMIRGGKIGIRDQFTTVEEMHERIVEGWNSVVRPTDTVYMLGDLTLERPKRTRPGLPDERTANDVSHFWDRLCAVVNRLHGKKRLILGNHDHLPMVAYSALGFDKVLAYRELGGFVFSHIPLHPGSLKRWKGNVHGHVHTNTLRNFAVVGDDNPADNSYVFRPAVKYLNVSCEVLDYVPISLEQIRAEFKARGIE